MDPHTMINGANTPPYNLAEIFHFPMNGGGGQGVGQFGQFGNAVNEEVQCDDPMSLSGGGGAGKKRRAVDEETGTSNANGSNDGDGKRFKTSEDREEKNDSEAEAEPGSGKPVEKKAQAPEPVKDYIHVRARRGQATDSHSLAERARREKISERMKILQDLVPGCNKVIGKALVLDEIINYIQSLQRQVEFLSMKLETVNSRMNPGFEVFPHKDFGQQAFDANAMAFTSQAPREYSRGSSPEWLHMQIGGNFERTS